MTWGTGEAAAVMCVTDQERMRDVWNALGRTSDVRNR